MRRDLPHVGWREWVALPALGVPRIKAKIDTGARTSALHAFDIGFARRSGVTYVRFVLHPLQRSGKGSVTVEVAMLGERSVKSSNGLISRRPVILTEVEILGQRRLVELTLVPRDEMGFRLLLGREAIRDGFLVDAGRSFLGGRPRKRPPGPPPIRTRRG
ncbi:MAG TPA: RimK/LysX family protein [Planctomycetota bacterium]|nr:RimK/LysX family protein [Planctomycetota bacterium]